MIEWVLMISSSRLPGNNIWEPGNLDKKSFHCSGISLSSSSCGNCRKLQASLYDCFGCVFSESQIVENTVNVVKQIGWKHRGWLDSTARSPLRFVVLACLDQQRKTFTDKRFFFISPHSSAEKNSFFYGILGTKSFLEFPKQPRKWQESKTCRNQFKAQRSQTPLANVSRHKTSDCALSEILPRWGPISPERMSLTPAFGFMQKVVGAHTSVANLRLCVASAHYLLRMQKEH